MMTEIFSFLALDINASADSRTCAILPGALAICSSYIVCIESTMIMSGFTSDVRESMRSTFVSVSTYKVLP